ncbi:hypothetical protein FHR81_005395 [Actinoalloteichus hoggarensis]|uniref:Uncharacterized protein n=1 Tax=Actinoalloteichus hoggarensis TaxID=1470176 RepID=A0A221VWR6_9PSEU|nr:hypothetical protein [Actinoalloteichus hoggarensis]ASO17907.1 hypothetical protein AHOG_01205 [Actinoalloteichus hoggarensis]MBB5924318.1 hypothetical protein [Actinoalloteichus hoggarensis]
MSEQIEEIATPVARPGVRGCLGRIALVVAGSVLGTILTVLLGLAILLPWRSQNVELVVVDLGVRPDEDAGSAQAMPTVELRTARSLVSATSTVWIGERLGDRGFYGLAIPVPGSVAEDLRAERTETGLRLRDDDGFEILVPAAWWEGGR